MVSKRKKAGQTQREMVAFISRYHEQNGYAPTVEDIARGMNLSKSSVFHGLSVLREAGVVSYSNRRSRTIRVIAPISETPRRKNGTFPRHAPHGVKEN